MTKMQSKSRGAIVVSALYLILVFAFIASTTGCASPDYVRALGAIGSSELTATAQDTGQQVEGDTRLTARGSLEVSKQAGGFENVQVGLRAGAGIRRVDDTINGLDVHMESTDFFLAPTLRATYDVSDTFGLYVDGMVGYGHSIGDLRVGTETVDGDGGGLMFGVGAGTEIWLDRNTTLVIGVEWQQWDVTDLDGVDFDIDDMTATFGVSIPF